MEYLKLIGLDKVPFNSGVWTPAHQRLLEAGYLVMSDGTYIKWSPNVTVKEVEDVDLLVGSLNKISVSKK